MRWPTPRHTCKPSATRYWLGFGLMSRWPPTQRWPAAPAMMSIYTGASWLQRATSSATNCRRSRLGFRSSLRVTPPAVMRKRAGFKTLSVLVPLAAEKAQQAEQRLEHVVDVQVNRQRCSDVVGFAAIDDALD